MRRTIVAGNWKMHGSRSDALQLARGILEKIETARSAEVVVCPPFILIPAVAEALSGSVVRFGGQNLDVHDFGAFTGEVSGPMLKDYGCSYVIVGHSERRALYGETNQLVAEKFQAAQRHGLIPILCVGETLKQRRDKATRSTIDGQLAPVIDLVGEEGFRQSVIAYEPVWAIGTGMTATPDQAQEVHGFIRETLTGRGVTGVEELSILYGGSVKAANAAQLFEQPDIDGGLIGGASLNADEFNSICQAVQ